VLNKPCRFTTEEFEIMKSHTVAGAKMLKDIPYHDNDQFIKTSYEICRWHHERYDGKGYPDGLKGEEIPISAQVVALADVYDALTSKRVYKPAFTHEEAVRMILNGECGAFNPLLLECLNDISEELKQELCVLSFGAGAERDIHESVTQMLKNQGTDMSNRTVKLIEYERMKFKYLTDISSEIVFEYVAGVPEMIQLSEWSAETLGLPIKIMDPVENEVWTERFNKDKLVDFLDKIKQTTPEQSVVSERYRLNISGETKWYKVIAKTLWTDSETPELEGAIGKIVDVNAEMKMIDYLEEQANTDAKTGLLNHAAAKRRVSNILAERGENRYALAVFDLDNFKWANDKYGHLFGDEVLEKVAQRLKRNIRRSDIASRMGGDEFLFFISYKGAIQPQIQRIFSGIAKKYKMFDIGISMGIALTENFEGDFDELFKRADAAMYTVKRENKNSYMFYDDSMKDLLEVDFEG
ncbi:MAG: diguanylate cyclase, partial [Clostridia bacterium]|nr:diguanylate cyclase [Clostridia bacterium]